MTNQMAMQSWLMVAMNKEITQHRNTACQFTDFNFELNQIFLCNKVTLSTIVWAQKWFSRYPLSYLLASILKHKNHAGSTKHFGMEQSKYWQEQKAHDNFHN